jgi:hypothetical protein
MDIEKMWERLAQHQSYADQKGYGEAWAKMCAERTQDAAYAAGLAAGLAASAAAVSVWAALRAAEEVEELATNAMEWIEKAEGV